MFGMAKCAFELQLLSLYAAIFIRLVQLSISQFSVRHSRALYHLHPQTDKCDQAFLDLGDLGAAATTHHAPFNLVTIMRALPNESIITEEPKNIYISGICWPNSRNMFPV
ncbi:hypothetical protein QQP08_009289 [Theobroma cacao]|nr:hypothetical protein QQP08_009289 [Theobroma cacao]